MMRWLPIIPIHEDSKVEHHKIAKTGNVTARQIIPSKAYTRSTLMSGVCKELKCVWVEWFIGRSPRGSMAVYNVQERRLYGHRKENLPGL